MIVMYCPSQRGRDIGRVPTPRSPNTVVGVAGDGVCTAGGDGDSVDGTTATGADVVDGTTRTVVGEDVVVATAMLETEVVTSGNSVDVLPATSGEGATAAVVDALAARVPIESVPASSSAPPPRDASHHVPAPAAATVTRAATTTARARRPLGGASGADVRDVTPNPAPHARQNLAPAEFTAPQVPHANSSPARPPAVGPRVVVAKVGSGWTSGPGATPGSAGEAATATSASSVAPLPSDVGFGRGVDRTGGSDGKAVPHLAQKAAFVRRSAPQDPQNEVTTRSP